MTAFNISLCESPLLTSHAQDGFFIDNLTKSVEVTFTTRNDNLNVYATTTVVSEALRNPYCAVVQLQSGGANRNGNKHFYGVF